MLTHAYRRSTVSAVPSAPCTGLPCWGILQPVQTLPSHPLQQPEVGVGLLWGTWGFSAYKWDESAEPPVLSSILGLQMQHAIYPGDRALFELLSDEIKEEEKKQKHKSLPKILGSWELEVNGTEPK